MPPRSARRSRTEPTRAVSRSLDEAISALLASEPAEADAASRHLRVAAAALALADAADRLARAEIMVARDEDGATWEQVGEALGISKQGAFERFRTGPDGMHSRLYMQKADQASSRTSGSATSRSGSASTARKASKTRS